MKTLKDLTPAELILLQKHIELDKDHLVNILGKKQFQELLQFARPNQDAVNQIKADDAETTGNLIMAVNTILTGCFGGWMGFSAAMELSPSSPLIFGIILSIATLVGVGVGYQNFRFIKQGALRAIQSLQLLQFTIEILREIHKKRDQELKEIREELQAAVTSFSSSENTVSITENGGVTLNEAIDEKVFSYRSSSSYSFLKKEIDLIKAEMKRCFEKGSSKEQVVHPLDGEVPRELPSIIEQLIYSYPQKDKSTDSWYRFNTKKILIALIPTVLGAFGSSFVYFSSSAQMARAFNNDRIIAFLASPEGKFIKLGFALCMMLYFGFSFLYTYKKNYKRGQEIERGKETVIKMESALTLLDEQLFKFRQVLEDVEKIRQIFQIADSDVIQESIEQVSKK